MSPQMRWLFFAFSPRIHSNRAFGRTRGTSKPMHPAGAHLRRSIELKPFAGSSGLAVVLAYAITICGRPRVVQAIRRQRVRICAGRGPVTLLCCGLDTRTWFDVLRRQERRRRIQLLAGPYREYRQTQLSELLRFDPYPHSKGRLNQGPGVLFGLPFCALCCGPIARFPGRRRCWRREYPDEEQYRPNSPPNQQRQRARAVLRQFLLCSRSALSRAVQELPHPLAEAILNRRQFIPGFVS